MKNLLAVFLAIPMAASAENKKELPFYFPPGIIESSDSVKQLQEYGRYLAATFYCFQGGVNKALLIAGNDSVSVQTDIESTSSSLNVDRPTKMKLVLDHFVRLPDGTIRVTSLCDQRIITEAQLRVAVNDLVAVVNAAADNNYAYYEKLTVFAEEARAKKLGMKVEELRKILPLRIPGYKEPITFREAHQLPRPMRRSDFVPRELHLGYNPPLTGILGVTWLNTGVIYYNPQARLLDYLNGKPKVMQHEMVHGNINLQHFPLSEGFDVELEASVPEALYPENQIDLFFHGYLNDLRTLTRIYFGLDFNQLRKEIARYDLAGNLLIDEQKMRDGSKKIDQAKAELFKFLRDTAIPEFYSDPVWWSALNDKLSNKNSVLWVMMSAYYNPTILGGEKETMQWYEAHVSEIREMAEKAYEESGKPAPVIRGSLPAFLEYYKNIFTKEEQRRIQLYFAENPHQLEKFADMSPEEIANFLMQFKKIPVQRGWER